MNVFIINGGQTFAHSGGMFNNTLTGWTVEVMKEKGFAYRVTYINDAFDPLAEVENFKWVTSSSTTPRSGGSSCPTG